MSLLERIKRRVAIDPQTGCWNWTGAKTPRGYGKIGCGRRVVYTHRATHEAARGPLGPLQIDHLCRNTSCCNPDHLEAVTARENTLRGASPAALNAAKTHCKRGHAFTPDNTALVPGRGKSRRCLSCAAEKLSASEVGRIGAAARYLALSPERRSEIARLAGGARAQRQAGKLVEAS